MDSRIKVVLGDITTQEVDAIVNAADNTLSGGGGVDGAIHAAAGPELKVVCNTIGGCKTGEAQITDGFNLPARKIIHTVGPIYGKEDGFESELLAKAYTASLELAVQNGIKTIAFPAISAGAYGYPLKDSARVALNTIDDFLKRNTTLTEVRLVLFKQEAFEIYQELLKSS